MDITRNIFKQANRERRLQIGLWSSLASNIGAEIISDSGFDWILLDTEHSPNEIPMLVKRILDIGAQSILIPYVQTAEEAKRAVAAVRYPPRGQRGVAGAARASR